MQAGLGDDRRDSVGEELCGANPFDYLTELQRHAAELRRNPREWMPWNYRATLERTDAVDRAA